MLSGITLVPAFKSMAVILDQEIIIILITNPQQQTQNTCVSVFFNICQSFLNDTDYLTLYVHWRSRVITIELAENKQLIFLPELFQDIG